MFGGTAGLLRPINRSLEEPHAQFDTPEREKARQRAEQRLHDIRERVRNSGIDAHGRGNLAITTEAVDSSIHLMASVFHVLAGFAAQKDLAEAVHDQSIPLEQRWAYLSALHAAMTCTQGCVYDLSGSLPQIEQSPPDLDLAWLRLGELMTDATSEDSPYHAAMAALCRNSGITHLSPGSIDYPDAIRCMAEHIQPSKEWELGARHHYMEQRGLLEVIRFDHDGQRYVKTIYEPYPDGYQSESVKKQMMDLLNALDTAGGHNDPDFHDYYVAANAMYEAATQGMHTLSCYDFERFMDQVRHKLDDPTMGDYIFRTATARNRDLGLLMNPPDTVFPPLATSDQASTILAAARGSGMSDTQLWELALVLYVDPDEYGLAVTNQGL